MAPFELFLQQNIWIVILLALWVLPWKGYALWSAARLSHKWWFLILLVVNTLAILDIIYIFFIAKTGKNLFKEDASVPIENN